MQLIEEMKPNVSIRITAGCNETAMHTLVELTEPRDFYCQVINWDEGTYGELTLVGTIHIYGW